MMSKENKVNLLPVELPFFSYVIYVLEDGETYSGEPTRAVAVTQDELDEIEAGDKVYHVVPDWNQRDENGDRR
jgi:hypothetical protein